MVVIDTPEGIEAFRMLSIHGRMKLELKTGIGFRVPTFPAVKRELGLGMHVRNRSALAVWEDKMTQMGISFIPYKD
jgi:hypothetical protein